MEIELNEDFRDLLRLLNSKNVKYLLIGGYAVILHRHPRVTNDLDVVIESDTENIERCLDALRDFGIGEERLSINLFAQPKSVVRIGVAPVKVEILNYLEGVDFETAYQRRETRQTQDIEISLISLPDLLANKKAVGREQDLIDVKALTTIHKLQG